MVMDLAEGGDLAGQIKQMKREKGHFEEGQILEWFRMICLAVKFLHYNKVLH
jgi:serine/threonine protein kinase